MDDDGKTEVIVETTLGSFAVLIEENAAPITASNFLALVDSGAYDGGSFHRTVTADNQPNDTIRIAVIQGTAASSVPIDDLSPINLERTSLTGLHHIDGAISMARFAPDSAKVDFFICVGDQPELDFGGQRNPDGQGFAAFGRVVSGMEVVRQINASPCEAQTLLPPVEIISISRITQ